MVHNRLNTLCSGDTRENIARACDRGTHTTVSSDSTVAAVHQYDGILRILKLDSTTAKVQPTGTFMARVDELAILKMCFLNNSVNDLPVLAVLHEDYRTKVRRCVAETPLFSYPALFYDQLISCARLHHLYIASCAHQLPVESVS